VDRAGVASQIDEKVVLAGGERHGQVVEAYVACAGVDLQQADCELRRGGCRAPLALGAAQHGPDARDELAEPERLDHVVVGAELEQGDAVDLFTARRDHDDGHVRAVAQRRAHHPAVEVGKSQVEQHEVAVAGGQRRRSGADHLDVEALASQTGAQRYRDGGVIFYDKEAHCAHVRMEPAIFAKP
jgi:hypothetical protein